MEKRPKIRIGGVPEHFNLPIHLAIESDEFDKWKVQLEWKTYEGGTGQMNNALRSNEVDLCIILTEGILADIVNGNPSKIISGYVTTPLTWGIHTGMENPLQHYNDIFDKQYAISRFGSGSHLMAIVDAKSKGFQLHDDQFTVVQKLQGALDSLGKIESDVFYWEKFTTLPYVERGLLRRIGEFRTPWPCFVIAATDNILNTEPESVIRILRRIHDACDQFMMQPARSIELVHKRYELSLADAERWFHSTEWAIHGWVSDKMIESVLYHLKVARIIQVDGEIPELIWKREDSGY